MGGDHLWDAIGADDGRSADDLAHCAYRISVHFFGSPDLTCHALKRAKGPSIFDQSCVRGDFRQPSASIESRGIDNACLVLPIFACLPAFSMHRTRDVAYHFGFTFPPGHPTDYCRPENSE